MAKKKPRLKEAPEVVETPTAAPDPFQQAIERKMKIKEAMNWRRGLRRQLLDEVNGIRTPR